MNVLLVHAHPEPKSFSSSMRHVAEGCLRERGHDVVVSDLYAMGFNPVACAEDFPLSNADYLVYALEQRRAFEDHSLSRDIAAEVEKILACELLILNFPIFWFSAPAILKGWIDRTFLSGPFYGGMRFYDRGGLAGRKAWVTATLGGRPHMFGSAGIHGELNALLKPLLQGTLAYVGLEVLDPFYAYHIPYLSAEARGTVMAEFEAAVRNLHRRPSLRFPEMDAFDEKLYPKAIPADAGHPKSSF
jgi:NAD(P)H dehydrogenase (quinone)